MITGRIGTDLETNWAIDDPLVGHRSSWPIYARSGARDSATCYFEIDPGKHIGRHTHDAEETILVLEGTGTAHVGDESSGVDAGSVVNVPAHALHDVANGGEAIMRMVAFFSKSEVVTVFEQTQMPDNSTKLGTPTGD